MSRVLKTRCKDKTFCRIVQINKAIKCNYLYFICNNTLLIYIYLHKKANKTPFLLLFIAKYIRNGKQYGHGLQRLGILRDGGHTISGRGCFFILNVQYGHGSAAGTSGAGAVCSRARAAGIFHAQHGPRARVGRCSVAAVSLELSTHHFCFGRLVIGITHLKINKLAFGLGWACSRHKTDKEPPKRLFLPKSGGTAQCFG